MEHFFNDKYELGMWELKSDVVFDRIPKEKYEEFIDFAWETGNKTAIEYKNILNTQLPSDMAKKLDLVIEESDKNFDLPEYRVFSEYYSNLKKVIIYKRSITDEFENISKKNIFKIDDYSKMREFFIAHEIYHHLECHYIGLTSKKKKITTFKFGPIKITSGIRALSEVGAHSFTKTMLGGYYGNL